eukprot:scaffold770_cov255-Pinguiococcus_pyrenoidosus.AAC.49
MSLCYACFFAPTVATPIARNALSFFQVQSQALSGSQYESKSPRVGLIRQRQLPPRSLDLDAHGQGLLENLLGLLRCQRRYVLVVDSHEDVVFAEPSLVGVATRRDREDCEPAAHDPQTAAQVWHPMGHSQGQAVFFLLVAVFTIAQSVNRVRPEGPDLRPGFLRDVQAQHGELDLKVLLDELLAREDVSCVREILIVDGDDDVAIPKAGARVARRGEDLGGRSTGCGGHPDANVGVTQRQLDLGCVRLTKLGKRPPRPEGNMVAGRAVPTDLAKELGRRAVVPRDALSIRTRRSQPWPFYFLGVGVARRYPAPGAHIAGRLLWPAVSLPFQRSRHLPRSWGRAERRSPWTAQAGRQPFGRGGRGQASESRRRQHAPCEAAPYSSARSSLERAFDTEWRPTELFSAFALRGIPWQCAAGRLRSVSVAPYGGVGSGSDTSSEFVGHSCRADAPVRVRNTRMPRTS